MSEKYYMIMIDHDDSQCCGNGIERKEAKKKQVSNEKQTIWVPQRDVYRNGGN